MARTSRRASSIWSRSIIPSSIRHLARCPDHALGVLVGGTGLAEQHSPAKVVQQHVQNRRRLVRVQHGRKLLEVAKEDILPGGTATQRHVGGQQTMELVAMDEPPAGVLDCLKFA